MKKIESLTKEQENLLQVYKDKWLKIGLCTKESNKPLAEDALNRAYKVAGLTEPKKIIWTTSPLAGAILVYILKDDKLIKQINKDIEKIGKIEKLENSVRNSVRNSVWNSVRNSVENSVENSVRNSVGNSVENSVRNSVENSVENSVRNSVENSVWNSVRNSVGNSVWNSVRNSVENSVGNSVENSVENSVRNEAIFGQHDAGWLSFYDYFNNVCNLVKETKQIQPLIDLAKHSNWVYPYQNIVIISEKPIKVNVNENGLIHCLNGPAILYKDGFSVYGINGKQIMEGTEEYNKLIHQNQFNNKMDEILGVKDGNA